MNTFEQDLKEAVTYHGHICSGQIIGVRMARMAMNLLEIKEPKKFRDLIVYVESDRCISDAIGTVTGCKLGKRNLKWMDYGKTAATFLNMKTGEAVRIYRKTRIYPPDGEDLTAFYQKITDEEMFCASRVKVHYRKEDLPGKPLDAVTCQICGEEVIDGRQVIRDGKTICKACDTGGYYEYL